MLNSLPIPIIILVLNHPDSESIGLYRLQIDLTGWQHEQGIIGNIY